MRRWIALPVFAVVLVAAPRSSSAVCGPCKAQQIVTASDAKKFLFGGSDASGGIDDWYLTNGKVEAIIDDVGTVDVPVAGGGSVSVTKTTSNAVETGGTLIDVAIKGKHNDQIPQSFNVGGLSLDNVFLFRDGDETQWGVPTGNNPCATVADSNPNCPLDVGANPEDADCAAVHVYGVMLSPGVSTRTAPTLFVKTTYKACAGENFLRMRSEVWNQSGASQVLPIFDVFLWGGRSLVPFAPGIATLPGVPDGGGGFTHPVLDLSDAIAILGALTAAPYFAAPGNVGRKDGPFARGKKSQDIAYGYKSDGGLLDSDGPFGPSSPAEILGGKENQIKSIHSNLLSAVTLATLPAGPSVPDGASVIYNRRLFVGKRSDAASVLGDARNPDSIFQQFFDWPLGEVKGKISPGSREEATITFIRTGGGLLNPPIGNNTAVSEVRTKSSFSRILLPTGTYAVHIVVPGRDDVFVSGLTVSVGINNLGVFNVPEKAGKLKMEITDADTGQRIPAKVSFDPSPGMARLFAAFDYANRTGMCSNNTSVSCTSSADCGGNTCFRTCSNKEPKKCQVTADCASGEQCFDGRCRSQACSSDADCDPGFLCVADTRNILPESFPGRAGQLQAIYTHDGRIQQEVRPGTYTLYVSRGLEYTIQKISNVVIQAGQTTTVDAALTKIRRVVNTTGFMSADFHIHSGRSLDSSAPPLDRVRSFAGEGLEVMVATDHDINTDYLPLIAQLHLEPFITSIVGTEVTTSVGTPPFFSNAWGHINAWPQIHDPTARREGAIEDENVSVNVVYDRLRDVPSFLCVGGKNNSQPCADDSECPNGQCKDVGVPAVQMNHPRAGLGGVVNIGIFTNIGYDPSAPITDCKSYPVLCPSSKCVGGSSAGSQCSSQAQCPGGFCGCVGGSIPPASTGCNNILNDLNVVPQSTLCTTPGCGSGFENANGTRNIDFDVMEIDNGGSASSFRALKKVRRDWLSLLNQAIEAGAAGNRHLIWGTGVSDSHRLVVELPGYARTFVGAGDFNGGLIDIKAFNQQVLAGNMVSSAGPFLTFTADNGSQTAGLGQTLDASGGSVNLRIKVQAAPWIPIDEVRIIKNGCVIACYNSTTTPAVVNNPASDADRLDQTTARVVRFDTTSTPISDSVSEDSYYIVEASPSMPASGDPSVDPWVDKVAQGAFPFGFTNPIFADFNGNGYQGLGVPEPSCPPLPPSCSAGAAIAAVPGETMYAGGPRGFWSRLLGIAVPAAWAHDPGPKGETEAEHIEEQEKANRRSSDEYFPLHFATFPTPKPEEKEAPVPPPAEQQDTK